jgi:hypothetical protein
MFKDLPISLLARTEGMNVDMITDIVINIYGDTVRVCQ